MLDSGAEGPAFKSSYEKELPPVIAMLDFDNVQNCYALLSVIGNY